MITMTTPNIRADILTFLGMPQHTDVRFCINGERLGLWKGCGLYTDLYRFQIVPVDATSYNVPIRIQFKNENDEVEETTIVIFPHSLSRMFPKGKFLFKGEMLDYLIIIVYQTIIIAMHAHVRKATHATTIETMKGQIGLLKSGRIVMSSAMQIALILYVVT